MRKVTCHSCGNDYAQIALHWNGKECDWPEFTDKQMELMRGLLLGDADIKEGTNGSIFRLRMTNKRFLEWISSELSPLSRGVFLSENSRKQKESALRGGLDGVSDSSNFNNLYGLRTVTHPQVDELLDWYSTGKKRYPDNMTTEMLRMWYVTDGNIHPYGIRITCNAQLDSRHNIKELLKSVDYINSVSFNDDGTITISSKDSKVFWSKTEAPPGFEYKWPK
jgi:hypothetical protein